jgi:hypothetical protein
MAGGPKIRTTAPAPTMLSACTTAPAPSTAYGETTTKNANTQKRTCNLLIVWKSSLTSFFRPNRGRFRYNLDYLWYCLPFFFSWYLYDMHDFFLTIIRCSSCPCHGFPRIDVNNIDLKPESRQRAMIIDSE